MKEFFEGFAEFFVNVLFAPLDALRTLELDNWWIANIVSWFFIVIGIVAFVYWMGQLKKHSSNNEEDKSITSHSYL